MENSLRRHSLIRDGGLKKPVRQPEGCTWETKAGWVLESLVRESVLATLSTGGSVER